MSFRPPPRETSRLAARAIDGAAFSSTLLDGLLAAVLSVVSSLLVGTILVIAPWTGLWESNYLLGPHPNLRSVLLSSFTRGSISGLGLVNILLALHEARRHLHRGTRAGERGDRA